MKNLTLIACLMLCLGSVSAQAASATATATTASTGTTSLQELQAQLTAQLTALQQEEQLIQKDLQSLVTAIANGTATGTGTGTTTTGTGTTGTGTTGTTTATAPQNVSMLSYNGRIFSEANGVWTRWNGSAWVPVTDTATTTKLTAAATKLCTGNGNSRCIVSANNTTLGGSTGTTGTTGGTTTGNTTNAKAGASPDCWAGTPGLPAGKSAITVVGEPGNSLTDAKGGSWTMSPDATLLLNGKPAGYSQDVVQAVSVNGTIYQQNVAGYWWSWTGTTWVNASAAPTLSAATPTIISGITTPTSFTSTDAQGNTYTMQCGQLLVNGKAVGTGLTVQVQNTGGAIMAQSSTGNWASAGGTAITGTTPTGSTTSTAGGTTTSGGETGNSNNGSTTDTSNSSGNTGGSTTSTGSGGTTGSSGAAGGTGAGGSTAGTTSTSTPKDPGTGVTAGSTTTCNGGMSPSGTTIPPATMITDCQGNVWTLAGGIPSMNQNQAGTLTTASLLLLYNGNLYAEDASNIWWQWSSATSSWIQLSADPRMSAGTGGGTTASGGCGSANGTTSANAPTTNLCTTGTASVIASATGSWNWSCTGTNGGTVSQCFALKPGATGQFSIANGQIIDPDGKVFIARGINVGDDNLGDASTNAAGAPLTTLFPGINFVRLNSGPGKDPSAYQTFISQLTALKIVVEIEDHSSSDGSDRGGGQGTVFTGSQLSDEQSWYAAIAAAYANNPYVWFGTDNEPPENPSAAALSDWQQQTYQTIRGAGNKSIIMVEMNCWTNPMTCGAGYTTSDYTSMTNIVWDSHYYGWLANMSTDQATVNQSVADEMSASQQLTSADGKVPVLIGEYGPSTTGESPDADGDQVVSAVQNSGFGSAAWHWGSIDCCNNLNNGNQLTSFGQSVANFTSSGSR